MANYDFDRIAEAIRFIEANRKRQPSLEEVASHVYLSPFHFQRMFTAWAGAQSSTSHSPTVNLSMSKRTPTFTTWRPSVRNGFA